MADLFIFEQVQMGFTPGNGLSVERAIENGATLKSNDVGIFVPFKVELVHFVTLGPIGAPLEADVVREFVVRYVVLFSRRQIRVVKVEAEDAGDLCLLKDILCVGPILGVDRVRMLLQFDERGVPIVHKHVFIYVKDTTTNRYEG